MPKFEYIQAPNFEIRPDSLPLGSIFGRIEKPTALLNLYDREYIPSYSIAKSVIGPFSAANTTSLDYKAGLNATAVQGLAGSGDIVYTRSKNAENAFICTQLETQSFDPDMAYIVKSIKAPDVQEHLEACPFWKKKVYMVTGIKLAKNLHVKQNQGSKHGGILSIGADATALGIPVGGKLETSVSPSSTQSVAYQAPPEVVFAMRITAIHPRGDASAKVKPVTDSALYSDDVDVDTTEEDPEWTTSDVTFGDFGESTRELSITSPEQVQ